MIIVKNGIDIIQRKSRQPLYRRFMTTHHHPKALFWISASYAFFMVALGCIMASLSLYQMEGLHIPSASAYETYAGAMALFWILPLGGGYLSSKMGYVHAAKVGLLFCLIGFITLCWQNQMALYAGLAMIVVGNAFTTPATWCLVDHCYSKTSDLRESGFTLFYLLFNLSSVLGIFFGGYLAHRWGFPFEFGLDALCILIAYCILHVAKHKIAPHKGRTIAPLVLWSSKAIWGFLILVSIIATPLAMFLFDHMDLNNTLSIFLTIAITLTLFKIAYNEKTKLSKRKIITFVTLSLISIIFWTLYSLEPSFLSVYIEKNVDTQFLGIDIPASSYFAFDGIFVILIGLILTRLWIYLEQKKKNPALPIKFASSLIIIGLGFAFLALTSRAMGSSLMPSSYIVFAYALFSLAELLISPIGISMVGSLAPEGKEGLMMGFWQLCIGIGSTLSGFIAVAPHLSFHHAAPLAVTNPIYSDVFWAVSLTSIAAGCLLLPLAQKLKRLIAEKKGA